MNSKNAVTPAEGVYYVLPMKKGIKVMSLRADETPDPAHMFYWPKVLTELAHQYGVHAWDIPMELKTAYTGIPRGRITREEDHKTHLPTGNWIIHHGNDSSIKNIQSFVLQDFGLWPLHAAGKVHWVYSDHETMDPNDKALVKDTFGV